MESAPGLALFREPTESAPEPAPFREPTESAPEPAPFRELTESAPESAPVREPTESAPLWPHAPPVPPWYQWLPLSPGPLPLHGPGPPSFPDCAPIRQFPLSDARERLEAIPLRGVVSGVQARRPPSHHQRSPSSFLLDSFILSPHTCAPTHHIPSCSPSSRTTYTTHSRHSACWYQMFMHMCVCTGWSGFFLFGSQRRRSLSLPVLTLIFPALLPCLVRDSLCTALQTKILRDQMANLIFFWLPYSGLGKAVAGIYPGSAMQ